MSTDYNLLTNKFLTQMLHSSVRKYAFKAKNIEECDKWKEELQNLLADIIGMPILAEYETDLPPDEASAPEIIDNYSRQKFIMPYLKGFASEVYLLRPLDMSQDCPVVIALHGHGRGVADVLGIAENENDIAIIKQHNYDYAVQLVKRGYVVIAPNLPGFGSSRTATKQLWECDDSQPLAVMGGITLLGIKLALVSKIIDFLGALPEVDSSRIGCLGLSGGGQVTLYAAALDKRIKAAVISGYICQFKDSILAMYHCACNYIPHLYRYVEICDIASLIAPRPLFIESGDKDEIFPIESAVQAVREISAAYELHGAMEKISHEIFQGPHRFNGEGAFEFMHKALR